MKNTLLSFIFQIVTFSSIKVNIGNVPVLGIRLSRIGDCEIFVVSMSTFHQVAKAIVVDVT